MKYFFLFLLFFSFLSLSAQKIDGTWELVVRKGDNPCAADQTLYLAEKGSAAAMTRGTNSEECASSTRSFTSWTLEKKEVKLRSGKVNKVKLITLESAGADASVEMVLLEFEGDFMLLGSGTAAQRGSKNTARSIYRRVAE